MRIAAAAILPLLAALPAAAGAQQAAAAPSARSAVGEAGQRQTREQVDPEPMARIDTRIQNRVQSRLRNRVDRFYDPRANAISPFAVASEQARVTGQPTRR